MSAINDGGPAFPVQDASKWQGHGISARDYFAAKALVGLMAEYANPRYGVEAEPYCQSHDDDIAKCAYRLADSMLKAREVQP